MRRLRFLKSFCWSIKDWFPLGQDLRNNISFHVRQPAPHSVVLEGELFMIEAKEVKNGGVQIVERMNVLHGALAEFIGHAVAYAGSNPRASEPAGEAIRVVITALRAFLEKGHAAKFRTPDHKS